jgi:ATPase subunit of ABC transporter with duplicated ATPase domains
LGIAAFGIEKQLKNLSGGQRAKVILGKLLLQSPDVLLLDEPTNFLDTEHITWLTEYLRNFEGAFLLISHEFDFLDKVTTGILDIEFQKMTKYSGNLQKFLAAKQINAETYIRNYGKQQEEIKRHEAFITRFRAQANHARQAQSLIKKLD